MIRTLDEALATFDYHKPSDDQVARIFAVRHAAKQFVANIWMSCPEGPDRTVAIRKVHEAMMTANKSIELENEAT